MVKVRNMTSPRTGNPVANQFIIYTDEGTIFQSYETVIAEVSYDNVVTLDTDAYDYSRTTSKYLNRFLGVSSKKEGLAMADHVDNLNT